MIVLNIRFWRACSLLLSIHKLPPPTDLCNGSHPDKKQQVNSDGNYVLYHSAQIAAQRAGSSPLTQNLNISTIPLTLLVNSRHYGCWEKKRPTVCLWKSINLFTGKCVLSHSIKLKHGRHNTAVVKPQFNQLNYGLGAASRHSGTSKRWSSVDLSLIKKCTITGLNVRRDWPSSFNGICRFRSISGESWLWRQVSAGDPVWKRDIYSTLVVVFVLLWTDSQLTCLLGIPLFSREAQVSLHTFAQTKF